MKQQQKQKYCMAALLPAMHVAIVVVVVVAAVVAVSTFLPSHAAVQV